MAHYLSVGCKNRDSKTLGFELEHFVVEKDSLATVPYMADKGSDAPSVEKVLERLKDYYSECSFEKNVKGDVHLFGLSRGKVAISLEPGSQLEVSIGPACSVPEIDKLYRGFRSELDPILDSMGLTLLELGYHPTAMARDISLLPKLRYEYMDTYFSETGKHGICMMRATASTQVSVDYVSEADAIRKFRIANALGPLIAFITDNAPVFEGERITAYGGTAERAQSGFVVPPRMARMLCWDDTDPLRCLVARGAFDHGYRFTHYAEDLLEAPGIFLPEKDEHSDPEYLGFNTLKRVLPNEYLSEELVLHILSLFFFDARFKTYLELRQADSMPLEYALAYTALISGIFYNPKAINYFEGKFNFIEPASIAFAKSALRNKGYEAEVYQRPATVWLDEMISFALDGLTPEEVPYLAPLAELVSKRRTLLDPLP